jgi:hemerythrin-like metal-binding protein
MEWKQEYSVQIPEIDKEHQIMLDYMNAIERTIARNEPSSAVESAIGRLASFAVAHFTFEETLMRIQEYPGIDDHIESHRKFVAELQEIQTQAGEGTPPGDVIQVLKTWLERHFLTDDQIYAASLSNKARELARKYVAS